MRPVIGNWQRQRNSTVAVLVSRYLRHFALHGYHFCDESGSNEKAERHRTSKLFNSGNSFSEALALKQFYRSTKRERMNKTEKKRKKKHRTIPGADRSDLHTSILFLAASGNFRRTEQFERWRGYQQQTRPETLVITREVCRVTRSLFPQLSF